MRTPKLLLCSLILFSLSSCAVNKGYYSGLNTMLSKNDYKGAEDLLETSKKKRIPKKTG